MTAGAIAQRLSPEPDRVARAIRAAGVVALPTVAPLVVGLASSLGRPFFVAGIVLLAAFIAGYAIALRDEPGLLACGVLVWLTVERFAIAALSPQLDATTLPWLLGYKEFFFPIIGLIHVRRIPAVWRASPSGVRVVDVLAIGFGIIVLASLALSPAPMMERVLYARRLTLLPFIYGVVRLLPWRSYDMRLFLRAVVLAAIGVALFGLLERFVIEGPVWRSWVPAAYYYHLSTLGGISAQGTDFPYFGLPVAFYDFTAGGAERRLVSTYLEATTLASFLALSAIVALAIWRHRPTAIAATALIALAGFLTLSKAGLLILAVGIAYVIAISLIPRLRDPAWLISMAAGLVGALVITALALESSGSVTGALAHFTGLQQGVAAMLDAPLGHGLGIGGNFGHGVIAAESSFGVILVQLGLPGMLLWAAWLLVLAIACATLGSRVTGIGLLAPAVGAALIAFWATAAFTESAGGFLGNWVYAFVAGMLLTVAVAEHPRPEGAGAGAPDVAAQGVRE